MYKKKQTPYICFSKAYPIEPNSKIPGDDLLLLQETIYVVLKAREKITDDSDVVWTGYESAAALRNEIDHYLSLLRNGDYNALDKFNIYFSPTCTFQEHSVSNGWADEYLALAEHFDIAYNKIKKRRENDQ